MRKWLGYGLSVLYGRTVEYAHVAKERIHTSLHTRHFPIVDVHAVFLSVRKGTLMENSRLSYLTWVNAINSELTRLKGISSMKLYRDIGVS